MSKSNPFRIETKGEKDRKFVNIEMLDSANLNKSIQGEEFNAEQVDQETYNQQLDDEFSNFFAMSGQN
jgi:hypothetical protein